MSFKTDLQELIRLNLPILDFVVVGSGALAIRGIRETKDLDVIVTNKLWNDLLAKYESEVENGVERIKFDSNIEILNPAQSIFGNSKIIPIEKIFQRADMIDGIKFISLNHLKKIKLKLGREKDFKDIELIDKYLNKLDKTNKRKIQIDEYSQDWAKLFDEEKKIIQNTIGDIEIEHIGSTSVSGLSAKPVIDMMARVENLPSAANFVEPLEKIGYKYIPELELQIPDRKFFQKRESNMPKYHLSFTEPTSKYWKEHILFRDYLRAHPEALAEYENLKTQLAEKFVTDFDAYNAGKTEFIKSIIEKASLC